jgi:hypothetical protein
VVLAPLASVALRSSNPEQHGVVSAALVVARMMGMLIGIAVLGAAGVHRFQSLTSDMAPPLPFTENFDAELRAYEQAIQAALRVEYGEIFRITSIVCVAAALVALGLSSRPSFAREPAEPDRRAGPASL